VLGTTAILHSQTGSSGGQPFLWWYTLRRHRQSLKAESTCSL
jgi:hypothetical protein